MVYFTFFLGFSLKIKHDPTMITLMVSKEEGGKNPLKRWFKRKDFSQSETGYLEEMSQ